MEGPKNAQGRGYDEGVNDTIDCQDQPEGLRERKKRLARDAMHRAALELVGEHGLANVTVDQIAEHAGVSPRTLFNYWGSKEAVVLGAEPNSGTALVALLESRPEGEDVKETIAVLLRAQLETATPDRSIRTLKRNVLRREPHLAQISINYHNDVQRTLIEVLAKRFENEHEPGVAYALAALAIFGMFATLRAVYAVSMKRDIDLVDALEVIEQHRAAGLVTF